MPTRVYETTVVVNAPVQTVYDYIADFPRHVEWNHQPQVMTPLTEGPVQVGSRYQTKERMASNLPLTQKVFMVVMGPISKLMYGASDFTVAEITALEPNKRVAWKARLPGKKGDLVRMNWEIRVEPQGSGTQITQHCEIAPPDESPFASMVTGERGDSMVRLAQEEVQRNLNHLKEIVERQTAAQPVPA